MIIGVDATPLKSRLTGVGNYVYYLLKELIELAPDDHFYLYAIRGSRALQELSGARNVKVRIAPFLGRSEALWSQTTLPFLCAKDRVDVVWGATQSVPFLGSFKRVITIYDFTYRLYPKTTTRVRGTYLRLLGKKMYIKSDRLVAISQGTAERLKELYNLKSDQVIIPPLKDIRVDPGALKHYGLERGGYDVMVGTKEPRKNLVAAIRAHPGTRPLVVVGAKGWRDEAIGRELHRVRSLGYLPDHELNALVQGARACIMPSLYEGYGMPLAEARVLGTPVVCADVPEMIEAAEGDALVVQEGRLEEGFTKKLDPPKKPTYPPNRALARALLEEVRAPLRASRDRD